MTSQKRWQTISGGGEGTFIKWDSPGTTIEGKWAGTTKPGKYLNGVLETENGRLLFPFSKSLEDLNKVDLGTDIKIHYLGKRKSKKGDEYHAFICSVALIDEPAPGGDKDEEVPF